MKKILYLLLPLIVACNNGNKKPGTVLVTPVTDTTQHLRDSVLENKQMDEYSNQLNLMRRPKPRPPKPGEPPIVVTPLNGCFLLDFNGEQVSNTMWNVSGTINCAPSGLSAASEQIVLDRMVAYYAVFNPYITITRDENVFNSYPQNKRRRIIITATMPEGFQGSGGVAYVNSFSWFDNSPAFVNSSGLQYNPKYISDACAHEGSHTLGNRHQSQYDANCVKIAEYLWGDAIMGNSYSSSNPRWIIGPCSLGCTIIQNDTAVIFNTLRQ